MIVMDLIFENILTYVYIMVTVEQGKSSNKWSAITYRIGNYTCTSDVYRDACILNGHTTMNDLSIDNLVSQLHNINIMYN